MVESRPDHTTVKMQYDESKLWLNYTCKRQGETEEIPDRIEYNSDDAKIKTFNNDLYYVLVEKSTGESALKVKSVAEGEGLQAYFSIYWWFVKTSGIAIQERSRKAMQPEPISKEEKMMENIEALEEDVKVVEMQGEGYKIPEM